MFCVVCRACHPRSLRQYCASLHRSDELRFYSAPGCDHPCQADRCRVEGVAERAPHQPNRQSRRTCRTCQRGARESQDVSRLQAAARAERRVRPARGAAAVSVPIVPHTHCVTRTALRRKSAKRSKTETQWVPAPLLRVVCRPTAPRSGLPRQPTSAAATLRQQTPAPPSAAEQLPPRARSCPHRRARRLRQRRRCVGAACRVSPGSADDLQTQAVAPTASLFASARARKMAVTAQQAVSVCALFGGGRE
jgi:hypothetical protein